MTTEEAFSILGLSTGATLEQVSARYDELRTKLDEKMAKAPTPGLKETYRCSLKEVTLAFEVVTHASDAASLPMVERASDPSPKTAPAFLRDLFSRSFSS